MPILCFSLQLMTRYWDSDSETITLWTWKHKAFISLQELHSCQEYDVFSALVWKVIWSRLKVTRVAIQLENKTEQGSHSFSREVSPVTSRVIKRDRFRWSLCHTKTSVTAPGQFLPCEQVTEPSNWSFPVLPRLCWIHVLQPSWSAFGQLQVWGQLSVRADVWFLPQAASAEHQAGRTGPQEAQGVLAAEGQHLGRHQEEVLHRKETEEEDQVQEKSTEII